MATSFTAPKTWASGDVLTAADMNTYVRDNTSWLGTDKPVADVYNSGAISTTTAVAKVLTFDSELYDNQGMHSTVTNTSRLTVPTGMAGKYLICGMVEWAANTTGYRQLTVVQNGTTTIAACLQNTSATSVVYEMEIVRLYALSAADYVELNATQTSGGTLNVNASNIYSPHFTAVWLST